MSEVVAPATIPATDADPYATAHLLDPDPLHAVLRDAGPVVYLRRYDTYVLARYRQVHAALVDWQRFGSGAGVGLANFRSEKPWRRPSVLLEADPPWHDAPRRLLSGLLAPGELTGLRERWLAAARELVDEVLVDEEFDAVPTMTEGFPLRVFPAAIGLPEGDRRPLLPYANHATNAFGPRNELVRTGEAAEPELSAWVADRCRRAVLAPGSLGARIWAAADREEITEEQAPMVVRSLLTAGIDTTVQALAAVLYALATHPEQWRRLRARPGLAPIAFDEAIRWLTPVQTFFRTATADVPVAEGMVVPDGKKVLLLLGAANRDPRRWRDPDRFDLDRDPAGHVGFGFGLHQCVGQHVARLEAEALLRALAERVADLELAGPAQRHPNNTLRAWRSLPLRVRPA